MNNVYAAIIALVLFAEMIPTVRWKVTKGSDKKILLEQGPLLKSIYYLAVFMFTAVNLCKGGLLMLYLITNSLHGEYISYFISASPNQTKSSILRQGGFTLLVESMLIMSNIYCINMYRPIVVGPKDSVFYKKQMVLLIHSGILDDFYFTSVRNHRFLDLCYIHEFLWLYHCLLFLSSQFLSNTQLRPPVFFQGADLRYV